MVENCLCLCIIGSWELEGTHDVSRSSKSQRIDDDNASMYVCDSCSTSLFPNIFPPIPCVQAMTVFSFYYLNLFTTREFSIRGPREINCNFSEMLHTFLVA